MTSFDHAKKVRQTLAAGVVLLAIGAAGAPVGYQKLEPVRQEVWLLEAQLSPQVETLAGLNSEIKIRWEALMAGQNAYPLLSAEEQISAFCRNPVLFPLADGDQGSTLCAKVDKAFSASYEVKMLNAQLEPKQSYLKTSNWYGLFLFSSLAGLMGFISITAGFSHLWDAYQDRREFGRTSSQGAHHNL